jgi:hypothetical protein
MKTFPRLWQYLAELFLEREMCQLKFIEKIERRFIFNNFFPKIRAIYEIMSGKSVEQNRAQAIWRSHAAYWISKATRAKAHFCARAPTHTRLHSPAHACTRTHAHTHTRTRGQKYVILFAFAQQRWFRERVSVLRYTYVVLSCLDSSWPKFTIG